jgi:mannose-6-phosphate isomerase class I
MQGAQRSGGRRNDVSQDRIMTLTRPLHDAAAPRAASYDKAPTVAVGGAADCSIGWDEIATRLRAGDPHVVVVDCYPGVRASEMAALRDCLRPDAVVDVAAALRPAAEIDLLVAADVTDDPVFGHLTRLDLADFFDADLLAELRARVAGAAAVGTVLVYGVGAALVTPGDVLVHADLPRREGTLRFNSGEAANLGADNAAERPSLKYKRAFFVDWRVADRHKIALWPVVDFVLDTTRRDDPAMITSTGHARALEAVARRPFRVVPWFEPAPWGGHWMKDVCDLDRDTVNFGWCFDCVPEENSLLLDFGRGPVEVPSSNLVFRHPEELLGAEVAERFGGEFPIRFDFLDTVGGGNLSLQVHPLTSYINEHFGLSFTQDESYYMLDAEPSSTVYLGLRKGIDPDAMIDALRVAQDSGAPFDADAFVNRWPARQHDHFLIPAGTVHCSGAGGMVLEISATPYIFTFKLWDWGRLGLDGRPRPVHIDHGAQNIQWQRDADYAVQRLINQTTPLESGPGWHSERTGLHEAEFIDTHRHWFTGTAPHHTRGGVNVLNLVEGAEAVVESPDGRFEPFVVHYAETFIVPAAVGAYTIRPHGPAEGTQCATIKAFVRPQPR